MEKAYRQSGFKDVLKDVQWFDNWAHQVEVHNNTKYQKITVFTLLGKTTVWGINTNNDTLPALVVFPGFRTSALFWDIDRGLDVLRPHYRIFLVETNGQPNTSDGYTPDIKGNGYGLWAAEVLGGLGLTKASIAGASFGGLVCLKLCLVAPELVDKVFLLNPGCLQAFSLSPKNLFYNLLPIIIPTRANILSFLRKAVFYKDKHKVSKAAMELLVDYEQFALTRYRDRTQKPYPMTYEELSGIQSDVYLLLGENDLLFPAKKSMRIARENLKTLKGIYTLAGVGHGIETKKEAMAIIKQIGTDEWRGEASDGSTKTSSFHYR